jgi:hypothetical protein
LAREGVGVVVAEDAPAGVQYVLLECAGRRGVAERPQTAGEVVLGGEGVGVVVAEDAPAGVEHVLLECAGRRGVAERPQTVGEVVLWR